MSEAMTITTPRVFTGKLHRVRRGRGTAFAKARPEQHPPVRRPARVAVMLALAHKIQNAIDRGTVRDQAEAARRLGLTRARVTQLLNLTLLAPEIQEALFDLDAVDGVEPVFERNLRSLARVGRWEAQHRLWMTVRQDCSSMIGSNARHQNRAGVPLPAARVNGTRILTS